MCCANLYFRISHATELSLKVKNWEKSFSSKEISVIKSLNSFQRLSAWNQGTRPTHPHPDPLSIFFLGPTNLIFTVQLKSTDFNSNHHVIVTVLFNVICLLFQYINPSPSWFCFPFISSLSMSVTVTVIDFHHHHYFYKPFTYCRCTKLCNGRRKRKGRLWWGISMDSRDRHRRRKFSLVSHLEWSLVSFPFCFWFVVVMDSWNGSA